MLILSTLLSFHLGMSCSLEINFHGWLGSRVGLLEKRRIRLSSASTGFELGLWLSLAISQLLLAQFGPNFKGRFLGPS